MNTLSGQREQLSQILERLAFRPSTRAAPPIPELPDRSVTFAFGQRQAVPDVASNALDVEGPPSLLALRKMAERDDDVLVAARPRHTPSVVPVNPAVLSGFELPDLDW